MGVTTGSIQPRPSVLEATVRDHAMYSPLQSLLEQTKLWDDDVMGPGKPLVPLLMDSYYGLLVQT